MADTATRTKTAISTVVLHLKVNNNDYILLQSPSPLPDTIRSSSEASFKPSMAVVIGIITTMFSVTFLLLMYAKHCKRNTGGDLNQSSSNWINRNVNGSRRRSGIDRAVVESLPMFRFGSLSTREKKLGLECCVCLNKYKDDREILRLLPKCNHTFHVECVDTWLDFHSTCPLCRFRVDPEDVLLSIQRHQQQSQVGIGAGVGGGGRFWRVSGRHSSAGETSSTSRLLQLHRQPPPPPELDSARKSLDSIIWRKKEKELAVGGGGRVGSAPSAGPTARPTTSTVGCRKDGLLMVMSNSVEYKKEGMTSDERLDVKMDDRMRVSSGGGEAGGTRKREIEERTIYQHRWSDLRPSDLLFLRSKKERGHVHRHSSSSLVSPSSSWISFLKQKKKAKKNQLNNDEEDDDNNGVDEEEQVVMMNGSRSSTEA